MASNRQNPLSHSFGADVRGGTAVEFAMVVLLFVTLIFGALEFSRALWAWNQANKATQMGVRLAVVSDSVAAGLQDFDGLAFTGNGNAVPITAVDPNPVVCTSAGCSGYGPKSDAAFDAIITRMRLAFPRILPENVIVEYRHIGLGFAGNPIGSDIAPAVTIRLQGMQFDFITPALAGLVTLTMPEFTATLTGEDFGNT